MSPTLYGQTSLLNNQFRGKRWRDPYWYWICFGALIGYTLLFFFSYMLALTFLNRSYGARGTDPRKGYDCCIASANGLSTQQRKRLTIAVELVANPSIIFMDQPTSGLDARSVATITRAIRNMVDSGRTIVCAIHQPKIDLFESF
ncbi:pleiotropic drug resistance protein 1-like [Trifolium pratense]|uniref:Pleiotropic drug resistance protein 1-like n=1 Tax=Trifolium pratense TaxID=57577 RepID=A0A2K3MK88_TRIPR|nr:pleiotropic drug resistance protein 1-like [Trifolium pratense]